MSYKLVTLGGDGTGPEVMREGLKVLKAAAKVTGLAFEFEEIPCGGQYYLEHGVDWPAGSEERCRAADLILLGAVGWPDPKGTGPVTMANGHMAGWSPVIGNRTKIKVVKNKVAPPYTEAEFDIMYGEGISKVGEILDIAVENEIVKKSGSWFSYEETKLGQGRDAVKALIKDNPELMDELEAKVRKIAKAASSGED